MNIFSNRYRPNGNQDLESVVRTLMFIHRKLDLPHRSSKDTWDRAKQMIEFWEEKDNPEDKSVDFWLEALRIARNTVNESNNSTVPVWHQNLDKLIKHFSGFNGYLEEK